jgi:hypothetical protein
MLVDALTRDENRAKEKYVLLSRQGKLADERPDRVDRAEQVSPVAHWPFAVLVKVAKLLKLLPDETEKHCEGLRYTRNLIHPVRAARDVNVELTRNKVETAQATVRECYEELENRLRST